MGDSPYCTTPLVQLCPASVVTETNGPEVLPPTMMQAVLLVQDNAGKASGIKSSG